MPRRVYTSQGHCVRTNWTKGEIKSMLGEAQDIENYSVSGMQHYTLVPQYGLTRGHGLPKKIVCLGTALRFSIDLIQFQQSKRVTTTDGDFSHYCSSSQ